MDYTKLRWEIKNSFLAYWYQRGQLSNQELNCMKKHINLNLWILFQPMWKFTKIKRILWEILINSTKIKENNLTNLEFSFVHN